jgi:peptidoglycan/LPS O-acetylase OafA/YrhL
LESRVPLTDAHLHPQDSLRLSQNNFDLLRLLFAAAVCLAHSYELSGFGELRGLASFFSSTLAVKAFFVVSGFLIFMSYDRSSSLASYARKRIRRIYPAYAAIVLLCAVFLFLASTQSAAGYFSLPWIKYLAANLTFLNFLQPTLPGVFESNKLQAVNGALWTIKIEVMFYLCVPLFGLLFRKFGRLPVIVLTYVLSVAYAAFFEFIASRTGGAIYFELGRQLPGQLSYFMAGAFVYYYLSFFEQRIGYLLAAAVFVLAVDSIFALTPLEPMALAIVVLFCGLFFYVGNFGKFGDFSYGLYIIHFPVIQLVVQAGWLREHPWGFLLVVVAVSMLGAVGMWLLVERRFLLRSSHYIASTESARKAAEAHVPALAEQTVTTR